MADQSFYNWLAQVDFIVGQYTERSVWDSGRVLDILRDEFYSGHRDTHSAAEIAVEHLS